MIDPTKPPRKRPGYRWEYRTGCQCKSCPWKSNCRGEDTPHWMEVLEMTEGRYPGDVAFLATLSSEVKSRFEQFMTDLDAAHERLGKPYGDGSLWQMTGAECWFASFEDGMTAGDALEEDLSYAYE